MKVLDQFTASRCAYPWDEWADGKPRLAIHGVDFQSTIAGFRSALYCHARSRGMTVRVSIKRDPLGVEFQFSHRKKPSRKK